MSQLIGLLINPIAGVGGPAGLKGSDGAAVQAAALARGSVHKSQQRAVRALAELHAAGVREVLTAAGAMGEDAVRQAGLTPRVVHTPAVPSTGADTQAAAAAIREAGAGLLLFVGGDGTARDVASAVPSEGFSVLGVPAGVKMYSGCFAVSPAAAGAVAAQWLAGGVPSEEREVLDVNEEQIRAGHVDPTLFGLVQVPVVAGRTQSRKAATPASEAAAVRAAATGAVQAMRPDTVYLLGPGGTTREVGRRLGLPVTPLGVDVVRGGELLVADASEQQLLDLIDSLPAGTPVQAVVTVIGGQGFLLGRGNQQLSAEVISRLDAQPLMVVATESKLTDLLGQPLIVDTGDRELDHKLAGYVRVITGAHTVAVYPVTAPES